MAPRLSNFLAKRGLIEFLPKTAAEYLQRVTYEIIDRRRKRLEVLKTLNFWLKIKLELIGDFKKR